MHKAFILTPWQKAARCTPGKARATGACGRAKVFFPATRLSSRTRSIFQKRPFRRFLGASPAGGFDNFVKNFVDHRPVKESGEMGLLSASAALSSNLRSQNGFPKLQIFSPGALSITLGETVRKTSGHPYHLRSPTRLTHLHRGDAWYDHCACVAAGNVCDCRCVAHCDFVFSWAICFNDCRGRSQTATDRQRR